MTHRFSDPLRGIEGVITTPEDIAKMQGKPTSEVGDGDVFSEADLELHRKSAREVTKFDPVSQRTIALTATWDCAWALRVTGRGIQKGEPVIISCDYSPRYINVLARMLLTTKFD
ncbi:MAG: hypothetical protein WA021_04050 [Minisyncoccia bacterium]